MKGFAKYLNLSYILIILVGGRYHLLYFIGIQITLLFGQFMVSDSLQKNLVLALQGVTLLVVKGVLVGS